MTFAEIENIAGVPIDHSFLTFKRKLLGCLSQPDSRRTWYDKGRLYHHYKSKKDNFNCIVERMKQQDSEHASDHDMPEDDKERMPEKYETVSLDDFVKYNIMKEILIFMVRVVSDRQASMVSVITDYQRGKMHHSFCVKN